MAETSKGARPDKVTRLLLTEKLVPPLLVISKGAVLLVASTPRMTLRLVAMKFLMPEGLPTLAPAATMPL